MYKICVFAGTTEGREMVDFLSSQRVTVTACVATEYGETLLEPAENLTLSAKRLTEAEMEDKFREEHFDIVVDATHPYASVVTENISAACENTGTEYLRLLRFGNTAPEDAVYVPYIAGAVEYLNTQEGNILLTTGSKELSKFTGVQDFADRTYARVLPMEDSLRLCEAAGVKPAHILAMQGPFSKELNVAMLKSVGAKFLVTKESGQKGGFAEKVSAAKEAGATLVVIGRPPQKEGLDFSQTVEELCRRFDLTWKPIVHVVGIGPGSKAAMTEEVKTAIRQANCLIGAKRMLEAVGKPGQPCVEAIAPEKIAQYIQNHREYRSFAVVMSGDTGFFSGTKKLLPMLENCDVNILPGISSLSYLCAKLGTSYEDIVTLSAHGRDKSLIPEIRRNRRVFTLLGGENGLGVFCQSLVDAGLGDVKVSAGEQLSYPDERITTGTALELSKLQFHSLCAALIENPKLDSCCQGLPDDVFLRTESVPMTKSEVRAVCMSKLRLTEDAVCWDIGAGTGSVSIEMALQAISGQIFAIERKDEAVELLKENCRHFGLDNVTVVSGLAPDACNELPAPTHVFIGGSSGNMKEILTLILSRNPKVRIVATAIALETIGELTDCMKDFAKSEVVSLTVARGRKAGPYHLMTGQNPIYIFTMEGGSV